MAEKPDYVTGYRWNYGKLNLSSWIANREAFRQQAKDAVEKLVPQILD